MYLTETQISILTQIPKHKKMKLFKELQFDNSQKNVRQAITIPIIQLNFLVVNRT